MKKILILVWTLITLSTLYIFDHRVGAWRRDPFSGDPPNFYLYLLIGVLGIGSLLLVFWYITTSISRDIKTGILLTLLGILVTIAPLLNFYIERFREAGGIFTPQTFLWPAGVIVFFTGAYLVGKSMKAWIERKRISNFSPPVF
jgi:hypothetical protein